MSLILGAIKNLVTTEVIQTNVADLDLPKPELDKKTYKKWRIDPKTSWHFYSGFAAEDVFQRASKNNPVKMMKALVVDYDIDGLKPEESRMYMGKFKKHQGAVSPNFLSTTFSGGRRAIWKFEEPIPVYTPDIAAVFQKDLADKIQAERLFPCLDEKALGDINQHYELGYDWEEYTEVPPLSKEFLHRILFEAIKKCKRYLDSEGDFPKIPLDVIAEAVDERFPGRWSGQFVENARGTRFWDEDADADSAIVKPEGMICFTGDKKFVSWREIFGHAFVEKFLDDKIGAVVREVYTDGKSYWNHNLATKKWVDNSTEQIRWALASKYRIHKPSEQNDVLHHLLEANRVDAAVPVIHRPEGLIHDKGLRILNIAKYQVLQPYDGEVDPKRDFPFLNHFLLLRGWIPMEQLDFFLAWYRRFYKGALEMKPVNGQALILAGLASAGKTFLSQCVIAPSVGGFHDAGRFFLGEEQFTGSLLHAPVWCVDDQRISTSADKQLQYAAILKKIAADQNFEYNEKFKKSRMTSWLGRVVVTCNDDPESLRAIPQLDLSNSDKVMLLKFGDGTDPFEGIENSDEVVRRELPYFLRWLVNWQPPERVTSKNPRWGVQAYNHPGLHEEVNAVSVTARIEEIIQIFFREFFKIDEQAKKTGICRMTVTEMHQKFSEEGSPVQSVMKSYSPETLGRMLAKLTSRTNPLGTRKRIQGFNYWEFESKNFVDSRGESK
ncbi:MAG: primase-helicase family protein [Verrucomicrobiota bacterium]